MTDNSVFPYTEFKPVSTSRKKRKQKDTLPSVVRSLREQLGEGEWFTQCSSYVKHQNSHSTLKETNLFRILDVEFTFCEKLNDNLNLQ